jgi:hypothetical protein
MPLINVMFQHGRTLEEASRGLEAAVDQVSKQFQSLVRRVEWAAIANE